jgi:hypothetical protein
MVSSIQFLEHAPAAPARLDRLSSAARRCAAAAQAQVVFWTRRFAEAPPGTPLAQRSTAAHFRQFQDAPAQDPNTTPAQVEAAVDALRLLFRFLHAAPPGSSGTPPLPRAGDEAPDASRPNAACPSDLPDIAERMRAERRIRHYSLRTESVYANWARRYLAFARTSPEVLGDEHARAFLEHLAVEGNLAAATQNQALNALVFLHRVVLESPLGQLEAFAPAKRPRRLPVVLTHEEVRALLSAMRGTHRLMAELLYGSGLRLIECLRLRVKDIDFSRGEITVREGKGNKDRLTLLPQSIAATISKPCAPCTNRTAELASGPCSCPALWSANIPAP